MKRILIIVLSLIIIGAIGYGVFYLFFSDPGATGSENELISANRSASTSVQIEDGKVKGWREVNRTGISDEQGLLQSWPEGGPGLIWSNTELPKGNSSVTFGNNTIYITGLEESKDVLVALDSSGNIKWKTPYGRFWEKSYPESRCTPTVDGERVYVTSGFGDIACINGITGEIIWSRKASEENGGTYGPWGIAESPIIDEEKLYFTTGGQQTTTIALDKNSGDLVWRSESLKDPASYLSPILIEKSGIRILVNITPRFIYGVDVSDGTILWKMNHREALGKKDPDDTGQILCVTPLYSGNRIYMTGGYNHGGLMIDIGDDGKSARTVWKDDVLDVHHGGVVLVDGYLYGANWINNGNGDWCCIDWNTGKKMWNKHWLNKGSVIYADGMLYIYEERTGNVGLLRPDPTKFDLVSSFKINGGSGPYWAHPVIHNGVLYIRHGEALFAYDIKEK
jgi:outer membrane protein assembly factor BamB